MCQTHETQEEEEFRRGKGWYRRRGSWSTAVEGEQWIPYEAVHGNMQAWQVKRSSDFTQGKWEAKEKI